MPLVNALTVRMRLVNGITIGLVAILAPLAGVPRAFGQEAGRENELKTGSRAPYVHRLTLYDENGVAIDPRDESAGPYSPRMTCGKCHPCGEIAGGWHFNAKQGGAAAGRPGEAWLLVDLPSGTQVPISGRGWAGTFRPADEGLSSWKFIKRFGRHTPGGGYGMPDADELRSAPEKARWAVSGPLEIDCMFCHSADLQHDPAEAAVQIEAENFKWAATAALGLAAIRGEARKAPDDWDPALPPSPDHPERDGPRMVWNKSRFDVDDRVLFNIVRRPPNERCYYCHSVREVGPKARAEERSCRDVHLTAGLLCVDCHRNGMDHMMARGYDGEAGERADAGLAAFSCAGCHLGVEGASQAELAQGGRYAAPRPEHWGLPPVHLEKLTCTACHSGPWPEMDAHRFQTSLAHGLGLATRERDADTPPNIVGPVFARQPDGKLAPQRLIWPAYWGRLTGEGVEAYALDSVLKTLKKVDPKRAKASAEKLAALTEEQIGAVLEQLGKTDAGHTPVYVRDGLLYRRGPSGELQKRAFETPAEEGSHGLSPQQANAIQLATAPYRWSLAHDVRPATQALGIGGCTDCHAQGAPIYYGSIAAAGVPSGPEAVQTMYRFRGEDGAKVQAWAAGFVFRPAFKWFGFACAAVVALLLLRVVLNVGSAGGGDGRLGVRAARMEKLVLGLGLVGLVVQLVTGLGTKWTLGRTEGWALLIHMLGAPLLILGVTGAAYFGSARRRCWAGSANSALQKTQAVVYWLSVTCGFVTMTAMLAAMTPLFGTAGQKSLSLLHERAGIGLVIALVMYLVVSVLLGRRRGIDDEIEQAVAAAGRLERDADSCSGSITGR
ncbi:MAG TPA: hypothetical protein PLU99_03450 [Phycisphaerae bacterium]|jgi:hypothetical protein|nr:hypothetical protein [Phycisphaerae bacterium]HRS26944.1 hypothetical protein [Phycisphaerae bacterium]HRT40935.1 hypothetical protein [Phycisphaerae bacterium]